MKHILFHTHYISRNLKANQYLARTGAIKYIIYLDRNVKLLWKAILLFLVELTTEIPYGHGIIRYIDYRNSYTYVPDNSLFQTSKECSLHLCLLLQNSRNILNIHQESNKSIIEMNTI